MRDAVIPLLVPLKAATEPLQTRLGAPNDTKKLHHNGLWLRGDLNRLGCSNTQEEQDPQGISGGNQISLCGSVDLGLLK